MSKFASFVKKASKVQGHLRMAITGPPGSGKTYSSIKILVAMGCKRILVVDTEQGSASKYRKEFHDAGGNLVEYEVIDNDCWKGVYTLASITELLRELGGSFDGIVVDSLSHFWFANGGALDQVEVVAKREQARTGGRYDSYAAWKVVTKAYQELITTILNLPCHFIGCLRSKTEYEDQEINGKKKKVKVGQQAQMRDGFEYEFDVQGMMTLPNHDMVIEKTRCSAIDQGIYPLPGANLATPITEWLQDYDVVAPPPVVEPLVAAPVTVDIETPTTSLGSSLKDSLLADIEAATERDALGAISKRANAAKNAGEIGGDDWKAVLETFKSKNKSFTANGVAAA